MFGREELGVREVEAREIEEKWSISPVWQREEMGESDIKHVGPTVFRIFPLMRRNRGESVPNFNFPILPLFATSKKRKAPLKKTMACNREDNIVKIGECLNGISINKHSSY